MNPSEVDQSGTPGAPGSQSKEVCPWTPYRPSPEAPWDLSRVVHLYRRAGFAARWQEIQRDLADGPEMSIARLVDGCVPRRDPPEQVEQVAAQLSEAAMASRQPVRLKAWWIYRMLHSADPLGEQLVLMWHNHFATSNLKVNDLAAMHEQNELFRRLARAPFGELLRAMLRDPALLVWLDAPSNRPGMPNENLARELMELFTLGIGHYRESDVKEVARSLTGWTVVEGQSRENVEWHDAGEKTVLSRTGPWRADDLIKILLDQPATAARLAWRIVSHFMGEGVVPAGEARALADGLRARDLDIGWAVATVLRSARFFDSANIGSRVAPPIDYVLGPIRALELADPAPSPAVLADWTRELGQDLFYPPNVGGWPGGRAWLSPGSMINRMNFAVALAEGRLVHPEHPPEVVALAERHGVAPEPAPVTAFLTRLMFGRSPDPMWRDQLLSDPDPSADRSEQRRNPTCKRSPSWSRRLLVRLLASPQAQLG